MLSSKFMYCCHQSRVILQLHWNVPSASCLCRASPYPALPFLPTAIPPPPGADLQLVSSPAAPSECTTVHNQRKTQSRATVMIGNFVEHLFCDPCTCTSPTKPTDTSNYAHQCTSAEKNMILGIWLVRAEQFCRGLHHSARIWGLCKWVGFDEIWYRVISSCSYIVSFYSIFLE